MLPEDLAAATFRGPQIIRQSGIRQKRYQNVPRARSNLFKFKYLRFFAPQGRPLIDWSSVVGRFLQKLPKIMSLVKGCDIYLRECLCNRNPGYSCTMNCHFGNSSLNFINLPTLNVPHEYVTHHLI